MKVVLLVNQSISSQILTKHLLGNIEVVGIVKQYSKKTLKERIKEFLRIYTGMPKIKEMSRKYKISLFETKDVNKCKEFLKKLKPDLGIVCGTGIIKDFIFTIPKLGCINYHNGLLPEFRGCASIFWALYHKGEVGYTIHKVNSGIDKGEIILRKVFSYKKTKNLWETINNIKRDMAKDCAKEMIRIVKKGKIESHSQDKKNASFFKHPTKQQKQELEARF